MVNVKISPAIKGSGSPPVALVRVETIYVELFFFFFFIHRLVKKVSPWHLIEQDKSTGLYQTVQGQRIPHGISCKKTALVVASPKLMRQHLVYGHLCLQQCPRNRQGQELGQEPYLEKPPFNRMRPYPLISNKTLGTEPDSCTNNNF
jgi:hypothetical protein